MDKKIVIAMDGPAGSGKATISKALAKKLDILYLSTGSLYRALAYKCILNGLDTTDEKVAEEIANNTKIDIIYKDGKQIVMLDGADITDKLALDEVSSGASKNSVIMDGRDIGSVVLPNADFKFYLDASAEVRAKRRLVDLADAGNKITYEEVLKEIEEREYRDKTREISPLVVAKDAIVVDSSNMTIDEVIAKFLEIIG